MIIHKTFFISVIFFLTLTSCVHSLSYGTNISTQNISGEITDTTYSCMITTIKGMVYKDVNIFGLSDSSFKILQKDSVKELMIKDVSIIKFYRRGFWTGALAGAGTAFAIGLLAGKGYSSGDGSQDYKIGNVLAVTIILSVPLGLIGGGIGVLFARDHLYVLNNKDFKEKEKRLNF